MRRRFRVLIIAGLLAAGLLTPSFADAGLTLGLAQQQIIYRSGFQVQNLSPNQDANVTIFYYPQGTDTPVEVEDRIFANSSVTYFPIHNLAGDTFNGSVVVESDTPVAAIINTLGDFPQYAAATTAFSAGSTGFYLPLVMCNNRGFDTWFNIQNAGLDTADVTIGYIAGFFGTDDSESTKIAPGRSKSFSQAAGSDTVNCDTLADPDPTENRFVGSATVTSTQPVVATVMQVNSYDYPIMLGYNGFVNGSDEIMAPLIMANNRGFYTGIQVQNAGTTTTTVTIAYADNVAGAGTLVISPDDDVFDLGPGEAKTLLQAGAPPNNGSAVNNYDLLGRYIGAATITSSNGQPLVAIVNQAFPGPDEGPFGTAYEAFNPATATSRLSAPLLMANNNTYYTGIQVQNVGNDPVTVTITYGKNTSGIAGPMQPQDEVFSLEPDNSKTVIQSGVPPKNGSVNDWDQIGTYVGSATVTAGGPIAAIVNEFTWGFPGDQFFTYNAINY